jgi:hypothetical protein
MNRAGRKLGDSSPGGGDSSIKRSPARQDRRGRCDRRCHGRDTGCGRLGRAVRSSVRSTAAVMRFLCGHPEPEASAATRITAVAGRTVWVASGATSSPWPTPRQAGPRGAGSGKACQHAFIDNYLFDHQNDGADAPDDQLSRQWRLLQMVEHPHCVDDAARHLKCTLCGSTPTSFSTWASRCTRSPPAAAPAASGVTEDFKRTLPAPFNTRSR